MLDARAVSLRAERARKNVQRVLLVGACALVLAIIALFFGRALEIGRLQAELVQLEAEKTKILREIESLQAQLQKKGDLRLIEYLARKELGLVKPGEEVYLLIEREDKAAEER